MVGLGTQDSFDEAVDFVERHDLSMPMVWDPSFESWAHYGVRGQPEWILIDAEGEPLERWSGRLDEDEVVALAAAARRA